MADELTAIINQLGVTQLGLANEAFIALVVMVLLIIGAVVVVIVSRPVLDIYPYLLPNARVRARKGRLFDEKHFSEIIESDDINEIVNYLRGFPDYANIEKNYLEKSLDLQLAETYNLVGRIAPENIKKAFIALAKKFDIGNIKTLITAKEANLSKDVTLDLLIPSGKNYDTIESLIDSNNVEDIVAGLDGTEYMAVLEESLNKYKETGMVLPFEVALDNYYLESLLKATTVPANDNTAIMYSFVGRQVDVNNIKLIIRAKADGLSFEDMDYYMIKNGHNIKEFKLKDLMESEDIPGVIAGLEGTDYSTVLSETLNKFNETGSIGVFEKALDEYISSYAKSLSLKNPLGVGPIIGFLTQKEKEIKNLKIIARAKREVGFPIDQLQEMLV